MILRHKPQIDQIMIDNYNKHEEYKDIKENKINYNINKSQNNKYN